MNKSVVFSVITMFVQLPPSSSSPTFSPWHTGSRNHYMNASHSRGNSLPSLLSSLSPYPPISFLSLGFTHSSHFILMESYNRSSSVSGCLHQHHIFTVHPCCNRCKSFIPFYGQMIFHGCTTSYLSILPLMSNLLL